MMVVVVEVVAMVDYSCGGDCVLVVVEVVVLVG